MWSRHIAASAFLMKTRCVLGESGMSDIDMSWAEVLDHADRLMDADMADLLSEAERVQRLVASAAGIEMDLVKQRLDGPAWNALLDFGDAVGLEAGFSAMFSGDVVNPSEGRPALHWAMRAHPARQILADGKDVTGFIQLEADRRAGFSETVRSGGLGFAVKTILHLGIGGSDLGVRLVWDALKGFAPAGSPDIRFAANVDAEEFYRAVEGLNPSETLVVIASKTFTTLETLANAELAKAWLTRALGEAEANKRLVAASSAPERTSPFGVPEDQVFPMGDWVGGRFSVWASPGLSVEIALGPDVWSAFLAGAREMDEHVETAPMAENLASCLALADVWNASALDCPARAVLPYAHRLSLLPFHLQQLEMESNGKSFSPDGGLAERAASPVVFGLAGTVGQHSFYQLLHQGVPEVVCEFIAVLNEGGDRKRNAGLLANCLAQAKILAIGRTIEAVANELRQKGVAEHEILELAPQKAMPGGRASTLLVLDRLDPMTLGALIALYEHRTYAAGLLQQVNSFDQWGVELGKVVARDIEAELLGGKSSAHDPSTARLIARGRKVLMG